MMIAFPFNLRTIGPGCYNNELVIPYMNDEESIAIGDVKEQKRNNMISTDVFECPYCGHKKAEMMMRNGYRVKYYVLCGRCGARGPIENTVRDAGMWWRLA